MIIDVFLAGVRKNSRQVELSIDNLGVIIQITCQTFYSQKINANEASQVVCHFNLKSQKSS